MLAMIYIKSSEYNITNNYNDKVKMILRSGLWANIKYVVTTLYSAIKTGFFIKIDNVSGSNIIKKVRDWRSGKMFVTSASQCRTFNWNVLDCEWAMTSRTLRLISARPTTDKNESTGCGRCEVGGWRFDAVGLVPACKNTHMSNPQNNVLLSTNLDKFFSGRSVRDSA